MCYVAGPYGGWPWLSPWQALLLVVAYSALAAWLTSQHPATRLWWVWSPAVVLLTAWFSVQAAREFPTAAGCPSEISFHVVRNGLLFAVPALAHALILLAYRRRSRQASQLELFAVGTFAMLLPYAALVLVTLGFSLFDGTLK